MRHRRPLAFVAIVLTAGLAAAELPENWKATFDGPAGYLLTKKEKKEWKRVGTAAEAEKFIDLFWAKRDPNLETPLNEFKEDFDLRVKAADESFGTDKQRGAMTERGEVLILLGRPVQRIEKTPEEQGAAVGGRSGDTGIETPGLAPGSGVGTDAGSGGQSTGGVGPMGGPPPTSQLEAARERGTIEAWVYDPRSLPINIKQDQPMLVIFRETRLGSGDYRLVKDNPRNTMAQRVISAAPDAILVHPDLTEIPRYGLIQGTQPATDAQLAWFGAQQQSEPQPATVLAKEGLVSGPRHFIWTHLGLGSGPAKALAVGRLRNEDTGESVGSFQLDVDALKAADGEAYELSVPVAPGTWALDLALASDGGPLAVTTVELKTTDVPLDKTVFSPFLWGADVVQLSDPQISDPFSIGGWHVIPRTNDTYAAGETLNYMAYVLQPVLGADRQPQFTFRVSLYQGARRLVQSPPQPAQLSQVAPDMWMFGGGIDLGKIPQAGDYQLEVQLTQTSDQTETSVKIPFTLLKGEKGSGASSEGDAQE